MCVCVRAGGRGVQGVVFQHVSGAGVSASKLCNWTVSEIDMYMYTCIPYSGLFSRGVYFANFEIVSICRINFFFEKLIENHTHIPSVATL